MCWSGTGAGMFVMDKPSKRVVVKTDVLFRPHESCACAKRQNRKIERINPAVVGRCHYAGRGAGVGTSDPRGRGFAPILCGLYRLVYKNPRGTGQDKGLSSGHKSLMSGDAGYRKVNRFAIIPII